MTTYLLHGGMVRYDNEHNDAFFKAIADAIPENGKALVVLFASKESNWPEQLENMQELVLAQAGGKAITFSIASREHLMEEIAASDAVLIRGGSTNMLLEALRKYPLSRESLDGKVVAGSSAGAYALAAYGYDKSEKAVRVGLGLVPVRALCHYLSDTPEERTDDTGIAVMNSVHQELELVVLKECEWKQFSL